MNNNSCRTQPARPEEKRASTCKGSRKKTKKIIKTFLGPFLFIEKVLIAIKLEGRGGGVKALMVAIKKINFFGLSKEGVNKKNN